MNTWDEQQFTSKKHERASEPSFGDLGIPTVRYQARHLLADVSLPVVQWQSKSRLRHHRSSR